MLTHAADQGVLVISLNTSIDVGNRAAMALKIEELIHAHQADYVIVELAGCAVSAAVHSVVRRTYHLCAALGASLAVVTPTAESRRLLGAGSGGGAGPALFTTTSQAILAQPRPGPDPSRAAGSR
ncbi:hypothetical protein ACWDYJ_10285 [Streptomyces sp. NPDC003042]